MSEDQIRENIERISQGGRWFMYDGGVIRQSEIVAVRVAEGPRSSKTDPPSFVVIVVTKQGIEFIVDRGPSMEYVETVLQAIIEGG